MKVRYMEESLLERALPPLGKLIAWLDAYCLIFLTKLLSKTDRVMEKEAVTETAFLVSAVSGILFVLKTVAQRPELQIQQSETLKTCIFMILAIGALRFCCFHSLRRINALPIEGTKAAIHSIQPFRPAASFMLLVLAIYGFGCIGKYQIDLKWYADGYFYLTIAAFASISGIYLHAATALLQLKRRIH